MKTIGIDCRFAGSHSGLGRFTREIVTHLLLVETDIRYHLFVRSKKEQWLTDLANTDFHVTEVPYPHYSIREQFRFPGLLKSSGIDLLYVPHFNAPFFCPVPFVITVHDLILHRYPNQAPLLKRMAYKILMSRAVRRAVHIAVVSKYTKSEVLSAYGRKAKKKISVIREGVDEKFGPRSREEQNIIKRKYDLSAPFFLYVGNAKEHKNVQMLIDAFHALPGKEMELLLVTGGPESTLLVLGECVRLLSNVPDDDFPALYSAATAFVTASLYEGYCLPVAEAQACGCPVIATYRGAIPEVANQSAFLVEPTQEKLTDAMSNPPEHSETITRSSSWQEAAEDVLNILSSVI